MAPKSHVFKSLLSFGGLLGEVMEPLEVEPSQGWEEEYVTGMSLGAGL